MIRCYPFQAVRPRPAHAAELASVPYDVVSRDESRAIAQAHPHNFIHVVRPDADLPDSTSPYDPAVYAKGKSNLDRFLKDDILFRDATPRIYLYRQSATIAGRLQTQTGIVCTCHADDYDKDLIKKHEKTRPDKEDDRVRHLLTLAAHAEPVFLAYRDLPDADSIVARITATEKPIYDFTCDDGVTHTVWAVDNHAPLTAALSKAPSLYVADGHHRSAAASRAAAERRKANPNHTGAEEYNRFLAVLFPSSQLRILPYHRVVNTLNNLTPEAFLDKLAKVCSITPTNNPDPGSSGAFCLYLNKAWRRCTFIPDATPTYDPVGSLDVSLLSDLVLAPILNITDLRTDPNIEFVGGIRGPSELERLVNARDASSGKHASAAAFSMHPTTMDQLLDVADAGRMMPPKSTWFEPKLRSGLLIHMLD